jgi:hypothetical protein
MKKLSIAQIGAVGFIFEQHNGNTKSDVELRQIVESDLQNIDVAELESILIYGLKANLYDSDIRVSVYWALFKRFNTALIPFFNNQLKKELEEENHNAIYQLCIALNNLGLEVFNADREGATASHETDLNTRDAKAYLEKLNHETNTRNQSINS